MSTDVLTFAKDNKLKGLRYDGCDDAELVGRYGHLFEYSPTIFGACLEGAGTKTLERRKREGLAVGMTLALECVFGETIFHFNPANLKQANTAMAIAGIRLKRRVSEAQLAQLEKFGKKFAFRAS